MGVFLEDAKYQKTCCKSLEGGEAHVCLKGKNTKHDGESGRGYQGKWFCEKMAKIALSGAQRYGERGRMFEARCLKKNEW